jgi:hypothetical protein
MGRWRVALKSVFVFLSFYRCSRHRRKGYDLEWLCDFGKLLKLVSAIKTVRPSRSESGPGGESAQQRVYLADNLPTIAPANSDFASLIFRQPGIDAARCYGGVEMGKFVRNTVSDIVWRAALDAAVEVDEVAGSIGGQPGWEYLASVETGIKNLNSDRFFVCYRLKVSLGYP